MDKYDGWTIKNVCGRVPCLVVGYFHMTKKEVSKVRDVVKEVTGIYRKRLAGSKKPFPNKQEYHAIVDAAEITKLVKMLRILGFLTQTKVYLFWKNRSAVYSNFLAC